MTCPVGQVTRAFILNGFHAVATTNLLRLLGREVIGPSSRLPPVL